MQTRFLDETAYLQEMLDRAEYSDVVFSRFMDHSLAQYAEKYWGTDPVVWYGLWTFMNTRTG